MKHRGLDVTGIQHPVPNVTFATTAQRPFNSTLATPVPNLTPHQTIVNMAMNGSGCRDIARILGISLNTVLRHLKKFRQNR
jgi:transposase-like protein